MIGQHHKALLPLPGVLFALILLTISGCGDDSTRLKPSRNCNEICDLEPREVWEHFYELTQTPRPSGMPDRVQALLTAFGHKLGLRTIVGDAGNVLIRKPASPGMEDRKGIILQAHMDMVPQKLADVNHNFETDPIQTEIVGSVVKAKGTSLGADNGIGMAMIMAVLSADSLKTGPIEALFTVDEETDMSGARGLQPGVLKGEYFINLDWEDEGVLAVGAAGGASVSAEWTYVPEMPTDAVAAYQIKITGLRGGHSGLDIGKRRGNAALLLLGLFVEASSSCTVRISYISAGTAINAIPARARGEVTVPLEQADAFLECVTSFEQKAKKELGENDPDLKIRATVMDTVPALLPMQVQETVVEAVLKAPNGVIKMSEDIDGCIQTSSNLGVFQTEEGRVRAGHALRSSVRGDMSQLIADMAEVYTRAGAEVEDCILFPPWPPDPHSVLLVRMTESYMGLFGVEPDAISIHAGLECAPILEKYPDLDMISIGPTIRYAHTPNEEVDIATVAKAYQLLINVLEAL